jgi:hypothetical protein
MTGFLFLTWHGMAMNESEDRSASVLLPLAAGVKSGQFSLSFCSPACLRLFFNHCVDELEAKIAKETAKR